MKLNQCGKIPPSWTLPLNQTIRVMKLTVILITITCLQLSAKVFSQKISLNERNTAFAVVIKSIEKQSGYKFFYDNKLITAAGRVTISLKNASLEQTLEQMLEGKSLSYSIVDQTIVLKHRDESMFSSFYTTFDRVAGRVVDENGLPMPGVSIKVKDNVGGAVTDTDGKFGLMAKKGDVLIFSFVGYTTKEVTYSGQTNLEVALSLGNINMGELVVVGYGTQKKVNLTGAVSTVKIADVVGDRPVTDLAKALQGAAPGLQVTYGSGEPGAATSLNIRGMTSINGGSPLILVDNVPVLDISMINPNDIETVSVLKDAASASIYGGRTAFGVVLITTKKAGKDQKVKFEYANNFSLNRAVELPIKATPMQTVQAYKDGGYVSYWTGQVVDTWLGLLNDYQKNPSAFPDGSGYVTGLRYPLQEFDMAKDMFRKGFDQNHNLSMSGGSATTAYRISLGSTNQDGLLISDKDSYSRSSINSFVSTDITKWFTAQLNAGYSSSDKTFPSTSYPYGIFGSLAVMPSYSPLGFEAAGIPYSTPKNLIDLAAPGSTKQGDLRTTGRVIFTPLKGLKLTGEYTYNKLSLNQTSFDKKFSVTNTSTFLPSISTANSSYRKTLGFTDYKSINIFANYEKQIGDHNLSAIAGFNQEESYTESLFSQMTQMINDDLPSISQGTGVLTSKDAFTDFGVRGWFGRINYAFKNKYLLELNGRYDGSSKFPPRHKYGFFPSASVGWRLGEESFMQGLKPVLSEFKLRGSWGSIGNQTNLDADGNPINYPFIPGMSSAYSNWIASNQRYNTLNPPALVSSNFTWEEVRSFNLGLNIGLFSDKLVGSFDWYQRETIGMLTAGAQLPSVLGAAAPLQNAANLRTNGWEVELSWKDRIGEVSYSIGANLYDTKSKITKYGNAVGNLGDRYIGQQIGEIWGYTTDRFYTADDFVAGTLNSSLTGGTLKPGIPKMKGSFPNPGDVLYVDYNGDGEISVASNTLADPGDRRIIGNNTRRLQYGANGHVAWKGFDMSFFMQGIGKRDLWIADSDLIFPLTGEFSTLFANQLDYWTPSNLDANFARLYQRASGNTGYNRQVQTKYMANGAYWRLKNLTFGYTLPSLLKKVKIEKLRVFVSGENLFTSKDLPDGIDPEGGNKGYGISYPFTKMYSFGLNLNF